MSGGSVSSLGDGSLGPLLRTLRSRANLSQEDLAARAGLSIQAIGALERGLRRAPHRQTLDALATALGLGMAERVALDAAARRFRQGPVAPPPPPPHNLPAAPTRLIGRDDDLAAVAALLARPEVRLLAITGPAGVGKTRLALALAAVAHPVYPDGAWFVDLAPVRDPVRLPAAIAQTLGVIAQGATPLASALQVALRPKRLLLVLDNLEQLLAATPLLDGLLAACPHLRLLITSRVSLPSPWAHEFVLSPLALPSPTASDPVVLAGVPAVEFFVQCARASVPDFRVTPGNAAAVAAICRQLDGLPLALELAAMRLRLLPPAELLARLTDRLGLLRSTQADRPARHQQLRETLAWSERLLSPAQQRLFRRLTIFAGGATVAAIEAVCAAPDTIVLDELAVLVDHHLVQRRVAADETIRLTQLETIREYALEQLRAAGEEAELAARHARYYCEQVGGVESGLVGPDQLRLFRWCDRERENLDAALAWCRARGDRVRGVQLCWELWRWWSARGSLDEARRWFDAFLDPDGAALPGLPAERWALALFAAARLAYEQDDTGVARRRAEQSLRLSGAHDPTRPGSGALTILAGLAYRRGDYPAALGYHTAALRLRRQGGFRREVAVSLSGLGDVALATGDAAQAGAHHREALAYCRAVGDEQLAAITLVKLSVAEQRLGDLAAAEVHAREALALASAQDERQMIEQALRQLADLALRAGEYRRARAHLDEALALALATGSSAALCGVAEGYARLIAALGDRVMPLQLLAAAAASRVTSAIIWPPYERAELDALIADAQRARDPAASERRCVADAALPLPEVLGLARQWCAVALPDEP